MNQPVALDKSCDVSAWASDDETRYNLAHVQVQVEKRRVVATNGHVLIAVPLPEVLVDLLPTDADVAPKHDVSIHHTALKTALKGLSKRKNSPPGSKQCLVSNGTPSEVSLRFYGETGSPYSTTTTLENDEAIKYPDVDQVFPSGDVKAHIALDPHYLKLLAEYAIANGASSVRLEVRDALDPLLARMTLPDDHREVRAVVMPMRF